MPYVQIKTLLDSVFSSHLLLHSIVSHVLFVSDNKVKLLSKVEWMLVSGGIQHSL